MGMSLPSRFWSSLPQCRIRGRSIMPVKFRMITRQRMSAAIQPVEPLLGHDRVRRGGRAGKRVAGSAAFEQPPFRQLKNLLTPTKLISDDQLEAIHLASLRVLK